MVGILADGMTKPEFMEKKKEIRSAQATLDSIGIDEQESIWYDKLKKNTENRISLMNAIFVIDADIQQAQIVMNIKDRQIPVTKISDLKRKVAEATLLVRGMKKTFESLFDNEMNLWKELKSMKPTLLSHQLKIFRHESQKMSEISDKYDIEEMNEKIETAKAKSNFIKWDCNRIALVVSGETINMRELSGFIIGALDRIERWDIIGFFRDFLTQADDHVSKWNRMSNLLNTFLTEITKSKRPMMNESEFKTLEQKLNAVVTKQQSMIQGKPEQKDVFEKWSTILQNSKYRLNKANEIVKILIEKRNKFKNEVAEKSRPEQAFDNEAISILDAFLSLFKRFVEYPQSLGADENKFVDFIDKLTAVLKSDELKTIKNMKSIYVAENPAYDGSIMIDKTERQSQRTIMDALSKFSGKHLETITTLLNDHNMGELELKSSEMLAELAPIAKLHMDLLDSEAEAFKSLCTALQLN